MCDDHSNAGRCANKGKVFNLTSSKQHHPGMEDKRIRCKVNTLLLNRGIFKLLDFRVQENFKVLYHLKCIVQWLN